MSVYWGRSPALRVKTRLPRLVGAEDIARQCINGAEVSHITELAIGGKLNNHQLKLVGSNNGLKVRIRVA